jgi:opacity protein-like surface antigen
MKSVLAAAAVLIALSSASQAAPIAPASAGGISAKSDVTEVRYRGRGRSRTTVIETAPAASGGVDLNALLLLGALGGGAGLGADAGISGILPLLLTQPQAAAQTVVVERRGRRRFR